MTVSRSERRAWKATERRETARQIVRRKSGDWQTWEKRSLVPGEINGAGWTREMHTAYRNGAYAVLVRTVETAWGRIEHASIHTLTGGDIPWRDKQRIKNELFGAPRVALEVFPAQDALVDAADAYHLWILPEGFDLPFTIAAEKS